ncbi:dienelactone hydrolase family protein [Saccharata proteae CBS 121410]|uniref:Dienelactone hydrolase family protein n=1 Tax=Saccharata proteae CBS 121410 TaxID=1314787 RepID=A0A9P4HQD6_9PEZI|nr:dienelactone hydrolase family protein [Saccharata proteae CBS 121410]
MSCPDCFSGSVHSGTPKGQVTKLHGLDTYISEPAEGVLVKGIIVIIPDAFGWEFVNNRILADHYAEKGSFKVYLPEFMDGNSAPVWCMDSMKSLFSGGGILDLLAKPYHLFWTMYGVIPFMRHNSFDKSWPKVKSFFAAVHENDGASLPVGAAGFCWGGKHTVNLAYGYEAANGKPLIDAGFTGHPSNLVIPSEFEKVVKPVSFALGDKDIIVKASQIPEVRKAIEEDKPEAQKGEVKVYPGAGHGFCVRADLVLDNAEKQANEAEDQAIAWFQRHFSKTNY